MSALWVFGYGSLVFRPAFAFSEREPGWLPGYARRFWQGSTDHRGVPGAPGRVVTLVSAPDERCWGMTYRVPDDEREGVLARLDHRERGGYERHLLRVELTRGDTVEALVYVATAVNDEYLGPAPMDDIAAQVRRSHGPSGPNVEYVLRLSDVLVEHGVHDEHVEALALRLRG